MANPVLARVMRGSVIENEHRGSIAVCDPNGNLLRYCGDSARLVYPRSAIKPMQAIPIIETGTADHFAMSPAELAISCSSHYAEKEHIDIIHAFLQRLRLDESDLECGAHAPLHAASAEALQQSRKKPGRIHNNCSGKHSGMLACARYLNEPIPGYIEKQHPAQQRWLDTLGEMADVDMRQLPSNYDGCGIPVVAMPLKSIATAAARFAAPDHMSAKRIDSIERIGNAIAAEPNMIGGSGSLDTQVMQLTGRRLLIKTGADGVYIASIPHKNLGIAIKIDDGNGEAAQLALLDLLCHYKILLADEIEALSERMRLPVINTRGFETGQRQAVNPWSERAG